MIRLGRSLVALLTGLNLMLACGAPSPRTGPSTCPDKRELLECKDVSYDGVKVSGGVHVLDVVGIEAEEEQKAIRKVDQQVERFFAAQRVACDEYNKCLLSPPEYKARSERYSTRLMSLEPHVKLVSSGTPAQRAQALSRIQGALADVRFEFRMTAGLPESAGGAKLMVRPGEPVPTNTQVHFEVTADSDVYLYLLQRTGPQKTVEVLFPNPEIGTKNPLPRGSMQRIPGTNQHFRVNDKDMGPDAIYVVVSRRELTQLESAVQQVLAGKVETLDANPVLAQLDTMRPGAAGRSCTRSLELVTTAAPTGCSRTRGLVLESETGAGKRAQSSAVFATDLDDDVIVKVFPYKHVTEQAYAEAMSAFDAPTEEGRRSRGVIVEN